MFTKVKLWIYGAIGLLIAGLSIAVRVLSARNSQLSRKVETTKARIDHAKAVIKSDKEADEQADVRLVEAKNEIKESGTSDELSDPNDW